MIPLNRPRYKIISFTDKMVVRNLVEIIMLFTYSEKLQCFSLIFSIFFFYNPPAHLQKQTKYWIKTCAVSNLEKKKKKKTWVILEIQGLVH